MIDPRHDRRIPPLQRLTPVRSKRFCGIKLGDELEPAGHEVVAVTQTVGPDPLAIKPAEDGILAGLIRRQTQARQAQE